MASRSYMGHDVADCDRRETLSKLVHIERMSMSEQGKHRCMGCQILDHLEAIGNCIEEMAATNPQIMPPDKVIRASDLLNAVASLVATQERTECTQ